MHMMTAILDSKGRLVVPKQMRDRDALEDGDLFVVDPNSESGTITFVRVENPLVRLVAESRADYEAGNYQSIEEVAAELGVDLDGE
jgi:bifunctional DNA-binding transcriptional regulator/antitoxin component of YhaV-PrlF toxin-antitoxin module